jgi:hypothetical protein
VPVFGYGEEHGVGYYAMSRIAGVGLGQVLPGVRRLRAMGDADVAMARCTLGYAAQARTDFERARR